LQEVERDFVVWFDFLRNESTQKGPVKVNLLMCVAKMQALDSSLNRVDRSILQRRIWRIFWRRRVADPAITHQTQRTRSCSKVMLSWVAYIHEKMEMLQIGPESVCNFNKTIVFFLPESKWTLARKGETTIGALRADSSE
jgi:hypothetical protein